MISLYRYHLPFNKPFITGSGVYNHRVGVLIRYLSNKTDLWAEASPLPGFSQETFDDASKTLTDRLADLNAFFTSDYDLDELRTWMATWPSISSLQYALSYLGLSLLSEREKIHPADMFPFELSPSVAINDVIGVNDASDVKRHIQSSWDHGFRTFKLKADDKPEQLANTLQEAAKIFPDISFRIDANQSWPADKLTYYSTIFSDLPIEYIEEPSPFNSLDELERNISMLNLPVALDESICTPEQLINVRTAIPNLYIVVKPALYGNIFTLAETISVIRGKRIRMVFSTLLESKIGREMTLFCASLLGDSELAHGLNTGSLFREDLLPDFDIHNAQIHTKALFMNRRKPIRFHYLNALNGTHS